MQVLLAPRMNWCCLFVLTWAAVNGLFAAIVILHYIRSVRMEADRRHPPPGTDDRPGQD
jgi:hypothetical protein